MSGRGGTCIERWRNVLFQHGVNWGSHVRVCMWKHEPTGSPRESICSVCRSGSPIAAHCRWTDQAAKEASELGDCNLTLLGAATRRASYSVGSGVVGSRPCVPFGLL